jgi:predicted TIM-barrel fold metal-dependent hydrolase
MIVDTHIHLVSSDRERFPLNVYPHIGCEWIDSAPDADSFIPTMEAAGVDKAILIQPHGAYGTDNSYICFAASRYKPLVPVAIIDPFGDHKVDKLSGLAQKDVVGLRLFSIPTPEDSWIAAKETSQIWEEAKAQNMVIEICALPEELKAIERCAEQYSEQTIVVDHCCFVPLHEPNHPFTQLLLGLSKYPNIVLKVTSVVIDNWVASGRESQSLFPALAEKFGPDRLVWGSDYAQSSRPYDQLVDFGIEAMSSLGSQSSGPEGLNALRIWRVMKAVQ